MKALILALFLALPAFTQVKKLEPPAVKPAFSDSLQAVVVTTANWDTTHGRARLFERESPKDAWRAVGATFDIAVGRKGLAWSEGDFENSAPTLGPIFLAYCTAWENKDNSALRKVFTAETIKNFEKEMERDDIKTLAEFLENEQVHANSCSARNEMILGENGYAEVRSKGYPNGIMLVFEEEEGQWKLTNRRPESVGGVKREGDGRSPAGLMPLTYSFGKADKANTKLKYLRIAENTECVDDVKSHHYNKIVNSIQVGIFDWKSSEKMAEITPEYDLGVFVAYNSYPAVKGRGSCIFLHIWETPGDATSGCTAMSREDLERVIAWLDPKKNPYLIQMPEAAYKHYEKTWKLPNLK